MTFARARLIPASCAYHSAMMFRRDVPLPERVFKGPRYQLLVLGRDEVKSFVPKVPYLIVSISDPGKPDPEIPAAPRLRGVLRLQFHDPTD